MGEPLAGLPPRYLRTPEAARFLGLSGRTLEKHRTYGTGPAYRKIGGLRNNGAARSAQQFESPRFVLATGWTAVGSLAGKDLAQDFAEVFRHIFRR